MLIRLAMFSALIVAASTRSFAAGQDVDFNRDVAPLLVKRCLECHNDTLASGKLRLTTLSNLKKGGESGEVVEPGKAASSLLFERVAVGEMPPKKKGASQKLPAGEIALINRWIEQGAPWPADRTLDLFEATNEFRAGRDWWSLQPVIRPDVPDVKTVERVTHPIDAFILARLKRQRMKPAPPADRRTLMRRVYYDMLGLPPTYEQVEAFLADESNDAWERVVNRLLESPHYGQRWARYWLDLVRFAETSGYERDQEKPFAWKFRDWVVKSLNDDKPYNRFILEQLAGDELPDRSEETVIATGFLRLGTWNDEPNEPQDYKYERLEDLVHSTSSAFLGLTVKCARCHDHKFDPIAQTDYYRMASVFWPGAIEPRDGKLLGGPSAKELGFKDVLGWTDLTAKPAPFHLLKKGDRHRLGERVEPASLSAIPTLFRKFDAPPENAKTSQRRLQLARWITDEQNPLPARVFVNRLWQHHFGQGIVRSPNNLGFRSAPPTHPMLLNWLAAEFVAGGWKIKRMHKMILMSSTYRQSSLHPAYKDYELRDSANRFWWRAQRRRLDAEALRDSMLTASGELDLRLGGPSFRPTIQPAALEGLSRKAAAWKASSASEQRRRSLYIYTKRGLLPPMMTTFDFADTTLPCGQRNVTTVAPQALAMMNNVFAHGRSTALARRILDEQQNKGREIELVWRHTLGRDPTQSERKLAVNHIAVQTKRLSGELAEPRGDTTNAWRKETKLVVKRELALHLRADSGVTVDDAGGVVQWNDLSPAGHHAGQAQADLRPRLVRDAINKQPAIRFEKGRRLLDVEGSLLSSERCTVLAVATDQGNGNREIISNWNSDANSTTSIFFGLTGQNTVRFSDAFASAGQVVDRGKPFVLTGVNHDGNADVYQNATLLASRGRSIAGRRLDRPWVIGEQGNIKGETWHGDIAEILVYNRPLTKQELRKVWSYLLSRYDIPTQVKTRQGPPKDPRLLALASLCHVLLNSNEFLYID